MISKNDSTNGIGGGSHACKPAARPAMPLVWRMLLTLMALAFSSMTWAQCAPDITPSATSIHGVAGDTATITYNMSIPPSPCGWPSFADVIVENTSIANVSYNYNPSATQLTYSFLVTINLTSVGTTTIDLVCDFCTTSIITVSANAPPAVFQMTADSGNDQTALPGTSLPSPLVVRLTEDTGGGAHPATSQPITWTVSPSNASPTPSFSSVTNSSGLASADIEIASNYSGAFTITATANIDSSATTTFTATARSHTYTIIKPSGSGDGAAVDAGSSATLRAQVIMDGEYLGANQNVNWRVTEGAATPMQSTVVSNSSGISSQTLSFPSAGTARIRASLANNPDAFVDYTITVAPAPEPEPDTVSLAYFSGDGQSVTSGQTLPEALFVNVMRNVAGNPPRPDAGATIVWTVTPAEAVVAPITASIVNSDGLASSTIQTSPDYQGDFTIRAEHFDDPSAAFDFNASAIASEPEPDAVTLTYVSGDGQSITSGQALPDALVVSVMRSTTDCQAGEDQGCPPVPDTGATVVWTVSPAEAAAAPRATSTVGSDGRTSITIQTSPDYHGDFTVRAEHSGDPSAAHVFHASATTETPISLSLATENSGDGQSGVIGQALPLPLRVQALRGGVGVPDLTITWSVGAGDASLSQATSVTDASGIATTSVTLGNTAGGVLVTATLPPEAGVSLTAVFSLTATAAPPHQINISAGDGQSGAVGAWLADDLEIQLSQPTSAPVIGDVAITWTVVSGGGVLESATTITDASGRARNRLQLGSQPGENVVMATTPDGAMVTLTATSTLAQATHLALVSGNAQAVPPGWPSEPLVVRALDANNQPVAGVDIEWEAVDATVSAAATVTDGNGQTSVIARTSASGPGFITARITGQSSATVTFAINGGLTGLPNLTPTQSAYANAMETMWPAFITSSVLTPEQEDLMERCRELIELGSSDQPAIQRALDTIHQDTAPTQVNAAMESTNAQMDNIASRIVALRGGASGISLNGLTLATPNGAMPLSLLPSAVLAAAAQDISKADDPGFSRWGFFATGTIGRGSRDRQNENTGYDFDTSGLTVGFDYRVRDNLVLGTSLGYSRQNTDMAQSSGKVETDGVSFSLYGSWYSERSWYLDAVLSLGRNSYDLDRRIQYDLNRADGSVSRIDQIARASGDGKQKSFALSAGRDFQKGAWNISPYLRGEVTQIELDGYEESMLDPNAPGVGLALAVAARDLDSRTLTAGSRLSYTMSRDWGILTPHAYVEMEREFKDDPDELTVYFRYDPLHTPIPILGEAMDSNYGNVGLGVSALFPKGRSAFFLYEKLLGASGLSRDTISLGVRMEF